jgi:hypothetical protein
MIWAISVPLQQQTPIPERAMVTRPFEYEAVKSRIELSGAEIE